MSTAKQTFIEKMGVSFERAGASPMLGRVYGALLVSDSGEMSAEELTHTLSASRGSISQSTRHLVDMQYIERTHKPGVRRDYFRVMPGGLERASQKRLADLQAMRELFAEGIAAVGDESPQAVELLQHNIFFVSMWQATLKSFFEEWLNRKEDERGERDPDHSSHQDVRQE